MPTTRPRHTITESDEVARALRAAARRWPEEAGSPSRLLLRLLNEGMRAVEEGGAAELERRRDAVRSTSGALTGTYPDGYLDDLRGDRPA